MTSFSPPVMAFIQAVAHKFEVETGATYQWEPHFAAVTYGETLTHPWPRAFDYRTEIMVEGVPAETVVPAIHSFMAGREHVLYVFAPDEAQVIAEFTGRGYRHAWTNVLLGRELGEKVRNMMWPEGVRPVANAQEVAAINQLDPDHQSYLAALSDSHLHDFLAMADGNGAAKGQIVTVDQHIAYIADMFTAPWARRRGLGGKLMRALHMTAARAGAEQVVLVPSPITREIRFYERFGYQPLVPMILLIPAGESHVAT